MIPPGSTIPRNYDQFIARLHSLRSDSIDLETLGVVDGYPVLSVHLSERRPGCRRILLTGGVHGDEPAGPEALLRFLERDNRELLQSMDFVIIPCVNPHGYVHDRRTNAHDVDLNRSFDQAQVAEVALIKGLLGSQPFDLSIDFHEDWEYAGFYLYELTRDRRPVGPSVIEAVKGICPIHPGPIVDEMPVWNGIVQTDGVRTEIAALTIYMYQNHCDQALTCESPSSLGLELRVRGHLAALDAALAASRGVREPRDSD